MIRDSIDSSRQLTIHKCSGVITAENLREAVTSLYALNPTPHHLWDLTDADVTSILGQDLRGLAQLAKSLAPSRIGSRTAIVAPTDFVFGLSRMYEVFAEIEDQGVELRVFRFRAEAEEWFTVSSGG